MAASHVAVRVQGEGSRANAVALQVSLAASLVVLPVVPVALSLHAIRIAVSGTGEDTEPDKVLRLSSKRKKNASTFGSIFVCALVRINYCICINYLYSCERGSISRVPIEAKLLEISCQKKFRFKQNLVKFKI
jgi:hypothetical protein